MNAQEAITELEDLHATWPLSQVIELPKDATVVVVGSYKGKLAEWFMEKHAPKLVVGYEPQKWAAAEARLRLGQWSQCIIKEYALGDRTRFNMDMGEYGTDGCSFLAKTRDQGIGDMKEAVAELKHVLDGVPRHVIDHMVINIEGYEHALLAHLMNESNILSSVSALSVQFHTDYYSSSSLAAILWELDKRYKHTFGYFLASWGMWTEPQ